MTLAAQTLTQPCGATRPNRLTKTVDVTGLARPLLNDPEGAAKLLEGAAAFSVPTDDNLARVRGVFGLNGPIAAMRDLNARSTAGWYFEQVYAHADGRDPDLDLSPLCALMSYDMTERRAAARAETLTSRREGNIYGYFRLSIRRVHRRHPLGR